MEYIYLGKIVNTHALKGELRIISNAQNKELAFNGNVLYLGDNKQEYIIKSYRKHKNYDMVILENIDNINAANELKGLKVYAEKNVFKNVVLDIDLINLPCYYNDKLLGNVTEIINNNGYKIININELLIPYNDNFIEQMDKTKITFKNIGGLLK